MYITVHSLKIQVSSSIQLKLSCCCNDSKVVSSASKSVDPATRVANFGGQVLELRLDQLQMKSNNLVSCVLKLHAVNQEKQKLIAAISFPVLDLSKVDTQSFEPMTM